MACFKLQPDKTLLSPDFDGYKLSSTSGIVTSYSKPLPDGLCLKSGGESSNSYLQTRLDALHNCLVADLPNCTDTTSESNSITVYCFNKRGHLLAFDWSSECHLNAGRVVWQVDVSQVVPHSPVLLHQSLEQPLQELTKNSEESDDQKKMFSTLQPTLRFASDNVAVVADGRSEVFVVDTQYRRPESHHTWLTVFSATIGACEVVDARVLSPNPGAGDMLHVLLVSVVPPAALPVAPPVTLSSVPSLHLITWLTLASDNGKEYTVVRERLYCGSGALEYCHFDEDCSSVVLLTHQLYVALYDSCKLVVQSSVNALRSWEQQNAQADRPKFLFMQTEDNLTVQLGASNCPSSDSVRIVVSSSELCVSRREGEDAEPLLKGTFLHPVDPETATWTVDNDRVEVNVCKSVEGVKWLRLFKEEELTGEELSPTADNTDRLAHLTSNSWDGSCDTEDKPAYNPGQLESCDDADTDLLLQVMLGDAPDGAPRAVLGNTQYLATIPFRNDAPPLFCLRHDVDGLVWRINSQRGADSERFSHTATFNAFGYVKASKTMAKYTSAPADCSFVCVSDVRSHVYVFCQPLPLGGELKNRRTGRVTSKVARQLLLSLPSHGEVRGLATVPGLVFLCTDEHVFAYALALQAS